MMQFQGRVINIDPEAVEGRLLIGLDDGSVLLTDFGSDEMTRLDLDQSTTKR